MESPRPGRQPAEGTTDAGVATAASEPIWGPVLALLPAARAWGTGVVVKGETGEAGEAQMNMGFVRYAKEFDFYPGGAQTAAH